MVPILINWSTPNWLYITVCVCKDERLSQCCTKYADTLRRASYSSPDPPVRVQSPGSGAPPPPPPAAPLPSGGGGVQLSPGCDPTHVAQCSGRPPRQLIAGRGGGEEEKRVELDGVGGTSSRIHGPENPPNFCLENLPKPSRKPQTKPEDILYVRGSALRRG